MRRLEEPLKFGTFALRVCLGFRISILVLLQKRYFGCGPRPRCVFVFNILKNVKVLDNL
jgi:hypothetical protein